MEIDLNDPVVRAYIFYSLILIGKTFLMAFLTGRQRFLKKVFANPEDTAFAKHGGVVSYNDQDVERVRRAHLNDLENIPFFLFVAFIYTLTKPNPFIAINLFRAYTTLRILHSIVYVAVILPQPSRGSVFVWSLAMNWYMLVSSLAYFYN